MTDFNKKIIAIIIGFTVFNISLYVFSTIITDKIADKVIEKLRKSYTPIESDDDVPSLDPDKVDPDIQPTKNITLQYDWEREWEVERTNP